MKLFHHFIFWNKSWNKSKIYLLLVFWLMPCFHVLLQRFSINLIVAFWLFNNCGYIYYCNCWPNSWPIRAESRVLWLLTNQLTNQSSVLSQQRQRFKMCIVLNEYFVRNKVDQEPGQNMSLEIRKQFLAIYWGGPLTTYYKLVAGPPPDRKKCWQKRIEFWQKVTVGPPLKKPQLRLWPCSCPCLMCSWLSQRWYWGNTPS